MGSVERPSIDDPDFLVSVVMPIRGSQPFLALQLEALACQDYAGEFEIVFLDNGMGAGTLSLCREFVTLHPRARIHDSRQFHGIAQVMNEGFKVTSGELVCKCDSDDVVEPDWLTRLVRAAGSADVVGGHLEVSTLNNGATKAARPEITLMGLPVEGSGLSFAVGANIAYWRDVYERSAGFCEYVDTEDVEFCLRVQRDFGCHVAYEPEAIVHYRYRTDIRSMASQARSYGQKTSRMVTADGNKLSVKDAIWFGLKGIFARPTWESAEVQFRRWAFRAAFRLGYVEARFESRRPVACACSRCAGLLTER